MTDYSLWLSQIDAHIEQLGLENRQPDLLYQPMHYILALKGKRIRPMLTMLSYQTISGRSGWEVINIACAMELFHNFTLLHDDIMDKAPIRRGKPTAHVVWDESVAILSGDALFALSMQMVLKEMPAKTLPLAQKFAETALAVCEGQAEDMQYAGHLPTTIPQYLEMIRKKTAVLLGGCLAMGAIAGGASSEVSELLQQLGEEVGMAFQLQDDLMDAFPTRQFGKQIGGDIRENKQTYLSVKALSLASPLQKERLTSLQAETDPEIKVSETLAIFEKLGIPALTQTVVDEYEQKAYRTSERLRAHLPMEELMHFIHQIIQRTH